MVGMMAIRELISIGWEPYRALSLVIGRMGRFGIETSFGDRRKMVEILRKSWGIKVWGY